MKKALGQTVRDLKRGVNKNVLKVPTIEQKVLDCTSNEPWGPHGTLLADIAQATRNYHEYQMIMSVLWKRTNDTGKNWRHVYKALTVLEYLVAHGAERVIDEIREHAYQIQALSNFQYMDSSGRDQGNNVRKKSQGLVVLVNDKERIQEVREKAASNREKFRNTPAGSMIRPGGYGDKYDDDNYRSRDDDRNGSGRGREYGYRDDDRYEYGRDGDRHGREYEDRYGGDDDSRGRSRSVDNYSSRGRSSNREKYEDDDHYSSRESGARADEQTQDGRSIEHKFSEPNLSAPPSYEDAVSGGDSPSHRESYGETPESAPKPSSPPASSSPTQATSKTSPAPSLDIPAVQPMSENGADRFDEFDPRGSYSAASTTSSGAAPTTSVGAEMDLLGSLSDSFTENPLALVPTSGDSAYIVDNLTNTETKFAPTYSPSVPSQGFDDPFGEGPFKAVPSANGAEGQQQQGFNSMSFESGLNQGPDLPQQVSQGAAEGSFYGSTSTPFGESNVQPFSTDAQYQQQEFSTHDSNIDFLADILPLTGSQHNVHPETEYAAPVSQAEPQSGFLAQTGQNMSSASFSSQSNPIALQTDFPAQSPQTNFMPQTGDNMSQATFSSQNGPNAQQTSFSAQYGEPTAQTGFPGQLGQLVVHPNFPSQYGQDGFAAHGGQPPSLNGYENQAAQEPQTGSTLQHAFQMNQPQHGGFQGLPGGQTAPPNHLTYGNSIMQSGYGAHVGQTMAPQPSAGSTSLVNASNFSVASQPVLPSTSSVSSTAPPPAKDKQFATKSTVWTDTLSRGLVNLDISGAKTNPMSDIGIDFDALNRREKRMEKPTTTPVTSTIHMGKAMGSGTGIGRAGAGAIRPPPTPMMGTGAGGGMNMGMGGPRPGVGMGGYGGMNQQATGAGMGMNIQPNMGMGRPNIGMGMNMNMGGQMQQPMGMGMNMNMGGQMQQPTGFPPGSNMQGGYNPMMGAGNFGQNPYGGGYRSI